MVTKPPKLETVEIFNRLNDLVRERLSTEPNDPRNAEIHTLLAELSRLILNDPTVKDFQRRVTELGQEYGQLLHHDPRRIDIAGEIAELYALTRGKSD